MSDRSVSWVGTISEELAEGGPVSFARRILQKQSNLFAHRSALFYTPTESIPPSMLEVARSTSLCPLLLLTTPILWRSEHTVVLVFGLTWSRDRPASCGGYRFRPPASPSCGTIASESDQTISPEAPKDF